MLLPLADDLLSPLRCCDLPPELAWDLPEEEIYLLGPAFASMVYEWVYIMPQFAEYYAEQDHTEGKAD